MFQETKIGHFLINEAPLEYSIIINSYAQGTAPHPDLIESIGYKSPNPLFKKQKFRRALIDYRNYGLYSGRPKKTSKDIEYYYSRIRRANLKRALIKKD